MLDPTTLDAYRAAQTAPARAQAVRDSLGSGTLTVELREGASLVYSGTFSGPMTAGADGSLSASAQLSGLVTTAGTPNAATWTCRIANGSGRYIEGSFGPGGRFTSVRGDLVAGQGMRLNVSIGAAGAVFPAATPLRTGGTVHNLLADWSGTGFHLLTTAPGAPVYRGMPHAGSTWDNARRIMWIYGADTHAIEIDMDNAVYGWRASDGLIIKQYDADPLSGYRMGADGIYWSSAAKNRPWAAHTFRTLRFVPESNEIEVVEDPANHAYMDPPTFEDEEMTTADRVVPIWYYNVCTDTWRHIEPGDTTAFTKLYEASPVGYHPEYGWFKDDGSLWNWLSPAAVRTTSSAIWNKINFHYHSWMHIVGDVAYKVGGNAATWLYSRHPLDDLASSERFAVADYAALSGLTSANNPSVLMPDGRILFFALFGTTYKAMILDPVADTVTDTGHTLEVSTSYYEFCAEWSAADDCAILLSRRFTPNRVYAYRPE